LQDRHHERGHQAEDPDAELLFELRQHLGQNWDLVDGLRDALDNLVVGFDGRLELLEGEPDLLRQLLRLARVEAHLLHLGGLRVLLDIVDLLLLVGTAEDAIRYLVEEALEERGVAVLALLERTLKLLDLVLRELV